MPARIPRSDPKIPTTCVRRDIDSEDSNDDVFVGISIPKVPTTMCS
jgi:hypothetical protein